MTQVETVASGLGFAEGPTLRRSGGLAVVSLDQQRVYAIEADGPPRVLAQTQAAPNGCTEGLDRVLYLAAFSGAWPARPECAGTPGVFAWRDDGSVRAVSTEPDAPNDLCFGPDGHLYVTDPLRGASAGRLWRVDVETGSAQVLATLDWYPNGIGFDADDNLWVADTVGRRMVCFRAAAAPDEPLLSFPLPHGKPDGFAFDADGHIVVCAPSTPDHPASSVLVFQPDGDLVDMLLDDDAAHFTNVAIDAAGTAYVTEARRGQVLSIAGACAPGLDLHPFRSTREEDP